MGEEIKGNRFTAQDFHRFSVRLREETDLLSRWLREGSVVDEPLRMGYELEAWLIDSDGQPAPRNNELLARLAHHHVVPELARYNVELNGDPQWLDGDPFRRAHQALDQLWRRCGSVAAELGLRALAIGILPTVRAEDLGPESMSPLQRYRALNEQVMVLRNRRPLHVEIAGPAESMRQDRRDVMLESAATSLQLHLQMPPARAVRYFNAAMVLSAASVAIAANAPVLFGQRLWHETRIPLFEQAVAIDPVDGARGLGATSRVSFGTGYLRHGVQELFEENRDRYPVLLPQCADEGPDRLAHLRLHNGTIWRWNRPLVGFDDRGRCHLRLEHRVMAAGPTIVDNMANAAFFIGALESLVRRPQPMERELPFAVAARNFYAAARHGLGAELEWLDGQRLRLRDLLQQSLIPHAEQGLRQLGLAADSYMPYLDIIRARVACGRTGAAWQLAWLERHGRDMAGLVQAYADWQRRGQPVHEWTV